MTGWPTMWREDTLKASGIPKSQFALDVLSAWRRSTPLDPYTNNPLGMPYRGYSLSRVSTTSYAQFGALSDFRAAFKRFIGSPAGQGIANSLALGEKYSDVWREIHALKWPGNATETDYPHVLLDMIEQSYRDKVQKRTTGKRKTTGITQASPEVHNGVKQQAIALHEAATAFHSGSKAIQHIIRRIG